MNILFMCVANSARSQMAEGLAKKLFGNKAWIESAGSSPKNVNPLAIKAMKEVDVDLSKHYSKSTEDLSPKFIVGIDYVITLCAEEVCPTVVAQRAKKLHWPFPDPAGQGGTETDELQRFRETRGNIQKKLEAFKLELGL